MFKAGQKIGNVIDRYREILRILGINCKKIVLYGSFAKGKARVDSDIDVLIISDDFQRMNLRQRLEILGIAAARIMEPIEALGYTPKEYRKTDKYEFLYEIKKTGKVIYS